MGATGRLGRRIVARLNDASGVVLTGAVTHASSRHMGSDVGVLAGIGSVGVHVTSQPEQIDCDVWIDVSMPEGTAQLMRQTASTPVVTGVTGHGEALEEILGQAASQRPILVASNFSVGVQFLMDAVQQAAAALPSAAFEIVETHHRHKVDAPSGTAKTLVEAIRNGRSERITPVYGREGQVGPRAPSAVGVHAVRGGDVVGEHRVQVLMDGEFLELTHRATSRDTFALGAIRAAVWLASRAPGAYTMRHVIGLDGLPTTSGAEAG